MQTKKDFEDWFRFVNYHFVFVDNSSTNQRSRRKYCIENSRPALWTYVLVSAVIFLPATIKWFRNMSGRRRVRLPGRFLEGTISKYIMIRVEKNRTLWLCTWWRTGNPIALNTIEKNWLGFVKCRSTVDLFDL